MFILYDLIFLLITLIFLPVYLFKGKFHRGFIRRLGVLPDDLDLKGSVWIHAVSVGEVMAIRKLVSELRETYPHKKLVISTVTPTGNRIAKGLVREGDLLTYLPLDFSFMVNSVIEKIRPCIFILAETEIWPNLINSLYKKNIPIVVVNGRISDSSFKGYWVIKFLLKPILDKISLFCLQTQRDAERLISLGVSRDKIQITGNMKFDNTDYADSKKDYTDLRSKLRLGPDDKLWIAASTHPGEEEIILKVYQELQDKFPNLKLLIASRHPERAKEVEKIVVKHGFNTIKVSQLASEPVSQFNRQTVFILDTIGQLISFYTAADIVFVGGSLVKRGGHNILEPAARNKPILFGPYTFNFRDIVDLFLENRGAVLVHNQAELKEKAEYLLMHPEEIEGQGARAKDLILDNQGASAKNLACLNSFII